MVPTRGLRAFLGLLSVGVLLGFIDARGQRPPRDQPNFIVRIPVGIVPEDVTIPHCPRDSRAVIQCVRAARSSCGPD